MHENETLTVLRDGIAAAMKDYCKLAERSPLDVKPKEDQLKCALYAALSAQEYLVHVEAAHARNGGRCDLIAIKEARVLIELKTAWAGEEGWTNKIAAQAASWLADLARLECHVAQNETGYFVLLLSVQQGSAAADELRRAIRALEWECVHVTPIEPMKTWNRLDALQCLVFEVTGRQGATYKGDIEVSDGENVWRYEVPLFVMKGDAISFEFRGKHEGRVFTGAGFACRNNSDEFLGRSTFKYHGNEAYHSRFDLLVQRTGDTLSVEGHWHESGGTYVMRGVLQRANEGKPAHWPGALLGL